MLSETLTLNRHSPISLLHPNNKKPHLHHPLHSVVVLLLLSVHLLDLKPFANSKPSRSNNHNHHLVKPKSEKKNPLNPFLNHSLLGSISYLRTLISCGCDLNGSNRRVEEESGMVFPNGKRNSGIECGVGIDGPWRSPKRQKDCSWQAMGSISSRSLGVCGFEDLKQRMRAYLSLDSCKEVLTVMSQVAKNIDEGRLKMKAHCPIVTDVGMKEKATRVLMCYNPTWLRIGLHIVFGGDSLLPTGEVTSDQELMFLKMMIEKQFFSHAVLAKNYAYNKSVGLYKPGYFEALGNVILKRFLLLVLVLDRAKSLSSLPIMYGIDGTDGGSPLLFTKLSNIKSSRQVIYEFLSSEVMHGEGNLVAHLVIVGYKVYYQQDPLLDYNFRITDLFEDLQDGMRLCRAIQLLQQDVSILKKMAVPSDNHKKNLVNCRLAIQYLKQAGVPLSDEERIVIVA